MHFLLIWIGPSVRGVEPRYQQASVSDDEKARAAAPHRVAGGAGRLAEDPAGRAGLRGPLRRRRERAVRAAAAALRLCARRARIGDSQRRRAARRRRRADSRRSGAADRDGKQAEVLLFDLRPIEVTAEWA
ncbi:Protein yhhW [Burkholderia humptydooensis MSMB43]|uniref:Protein yhhW n=1 Tax=Burkholderia humptydooensis MSMB43 TaxID=441157 RepID=A0ABN0FZY3_9BURK|nr:Protein yhhW [Burkholderia humptydooensis MSMB43]